MTLRVLSLAACAALLTVLVAPLPVPAAGAPDAEAAALLAKHRAYVGWQAGDGSIKTLRMQGEAVRNGETLRRFRERWMGSIYRSTAVTRYGTYEVGFTGRVFWQSNANGFTVQTVGEAAKSLISGILLSTEALASLPGTVERDETIDGARTVVVRVTPESAFPIDLWIDPETGALKRYAIDPGGKYEDQEDVLGYSDVGGGKRVLSSWRFHGGKTIYHWSEIVANAPVSTDELHPPKQAATWTFGPPTETTPLEVTDQRIFFNAVVNGHKGRFILDTGADGIALTDTFARSVGAKRVGAERIQGIGGGARANVYRVDTIAVGTSVLRDVVIMTGLDEATGKTNATTASSASICWPARSWRSISPSRRCASWTPPPCSRTTARGSASASISRPVSRASR